jgi:hypothetical protein
MFEGHALPPVGRQVAGRAQSRDRRHALFEK